jgi:hypothetical protein
VCPLLVCLLSSLPSVAVLLHVHHLMAPALLYAVVLVAALCAASTRPGFCPIRHSLHVCSGYVWHFGQYF